MEANFGSKPFLFDFDSMLKVCVCLCLSVCSSVLCISCYYHSWTIKDTINIKSTLWQISDGWPHVTSVVYTSQLINP